MGTLLGTAPEPPDDRAVQAGDRVGVQLPGVEGWDQRESMDGGGSLTVILAAGRTVGNRKHPSEALATSSDAIERGI